MKRCTVLSPLKAGGVIHLPDAEVDLEDAVIDALPAGTVQVMPESTVRVIEGIQAREEAMKDTVDATADDVPSTGKGKGGKAKEPKGG